MTIGLIVNAVGTALLVLERIISRVSESDCCGAHIKMKNSVDMTPKPQ